MSDEGLPLSKALADLRAELVASQAEGEDAHVKFDIDEIDLELNLTATAAKKAGGRIGWKLLSFEAGGEKRKGSAHVLKLKMRLTDKDGNPLGPISGKGKLPQPGDAS